MEAIDLACLHTEKTRKKRQAKNDIFLIPQCFQLLVPSRPYQGLSSEGCLFRLNHFGCLKLGGLGGRGRIQKLFSYNVGKIFTLQLQDLPTICLHYKIKQKCFFDCEKCKPSRVSSHGNTLHTQHQRPKESKQGAHLSKPPK